MNDLTVGNPVKNLVIFTLPIFAGNILQQLYNVADSIIIGKFVGTNALAAVGTSQPIFMILVAVIMGLNVSTEIMLSKEIGKRDHEEITRIANTMFTSVMIVSILVGLLGAIFSKQLLLLINTPEIILEDARMYLMIIFLGVPGLAGYNTLNGMIRSTGNTILPLIFLGIASLLNIILDVIFIKIFNMGVMGAALATIIAQTISFILCYIKIKKLGSFFDLKINISKISTKILKRGFKIGLPSAVQLSAMSVAAFVIQAFVNNLQQTNIISAYMIGMKVDTFAALPVMSLSIAMITLTGQNIGADNEIKLKKYERYGKIGGILFGVVMTLIMRYMGANIVRLFISGNETEVIRYGSMYIRALSTVYVLVTYYEVAFGVIKGRGQTKIPMLISIIGVWGIRVPMAKVLISKYGFYGVCLAIPIAWASTFILTIIYEWYYSHKIIAKSKE